MKIFRTCLSFAVAMSLFTCSSLIAQTKVKLKATADVGFSSMFWNSSDERVKSWGKNSRFKLKSIQEMGAIRFDASAAKGKKVLKATLYLKKAGKDRLRILRISTVNNNWNEGTEKKAYGPGNGACYDFADFNTKKNWAWPGSQLCDVILGAGHSLAHWGEIKHIDGGWISLDLPPKLIYAMCLGDSDGLAIQEAGDLAYTNNFIYSREAGKGREPFISVELGDDLTVTPSTPVVKVEPGNAVAKIKTGAIKVSIDAPKNTFCWRIKANGKYVERWQVAHPKKEGATVFYIEYLDPGQKYEIEVTGVSAGGISSKTVKLSAHSSKVLSSAMSLGTFTAPSSNINLIKGANKFSVWACPGLVKISPESGKVMFGDIEGKDGTKANAVWDGKKVTLFGCKGEYVSFQLIIEKKVDLLEDVKISLKNLKGSGGAVIEETEIELYKNWYAKNKNKAWQPAYCVPLKHAQSFKIPDPIRKMETQKNQGIYFDIYIPKEAKPGSYKGIVSVSSGEAKVSLPIEVEVFDFLMPDKLSFWPQLNSYGFGMDRKLLIPTYQLAHQHRNVFFHRSYRPKLSGKGKNIKVDWTAFDKSVGPLLSGDAFKNNRRSGVPIAALGLPFKDSWPTNLSPETYKYKGTWDMASDKKSRQNKKLIGYINEHYMTSPKIEEGLSPEYKNAFTSVQKQFIEHFKAKGWNKTEAQCLFMGKNTHRIQYKVNMWWTTDEPYHWIDWLAVRFFAKLWTENRGQANAKNWVFRSDISRPQWQGDILDGIVDNIHFGTGAFTSPPMYRRAELLTRNGGFDRRVYGSANKDNTSNLGSIIWFVNGWLHGANAALPWQSMGNAKALDINDSAVGGNAMFAFAGKKLGVPVVADIRLKAFRDGEQLVEYLTLFAKKYKLSRTQVKQVLYKSIKFEAGIAKGAGADNADALRFSRLKAWQISKLRRALAKEIQKK
ncbi:MAG: hypothetical protein COA79_16090 [Planctomycetota bacterium]|nr:MAG: hypothetical protein COA79_16090 [Planctomycetota bacterium]